MSRPYPSEKTCFKCSVTKPIAEFYEHPMMGDGHLGKCRDCTCRDVRENRRKRLDYYREYDTNRHHNDPMRREYDRLGARFWGERNPEKKLAHGMVARAIRSGRLTRQPCEACGESKTHAHHDDYGKPLDVRWLCVRCHAAHHQQEKRKAA